MGIALKAGDLRHLVNVEQKGSATPDGYGNSYQDWTTLYSNVPASIEPTSAREVFAAEKIQTNVSHIVQIRYVPNINNKMRLKFGNRIFNIVGIVNQMERNVSLKLMCQEVF